MKYRIYKNVSRDGMMGYKPGQSMWVAPEWERAFLSDDDVANASAVFILHNRDDRPDGQICGSLSVGDVVAFPLAAESAESRMYACTPMGWERVDSFVVGQVVNLNDPGMLWRDAFAAGWAEVVS